MMRENSLNQLIKILDVAQEYWKTQSWRKFQRESLKLNAKNMRTLNWKKKKKSGKSLYEFEFNKNTSSLVCFTIPLEIDLRQPQPQKNKNKKKIN